MGAAGTVIAPLAALIAPLAALALLGSATLVAINPTLVQLAVIGRKKRDASRFDPATIRRLDEVEKLEKFLSKVPDRFEQSAQLLAGYVDCTGLAEKTQCLERLTCIYSNPAEPAPETEKDVLAIILYNILGNRFIEDDVKERLRVSARQSRSGGKHWCSVYKCPLIEKQGQSNGKQLPQLNHHN